MSAVDDGYSRLLGQADAEGTADAMAAGVAAYAEVGIADRLRGSIGMVVGIRTAAADDSIAGTVVEVAAAGAVAIEDLGSASIWVVMLADIGSISGLATGHRPAAGRVEQHRSIGALLRPAAGSAVTVAQGPRRTTGMLERVGADHLQLRPEAAPLVLPFAAISWIRSALPASVDQTR